MMNSETHYRLNNYRHLLNIEIQKLELQLTNSERKLKHAKLDLYIYLGLIGIYLVVEVMLFLLILYYQHLQAFLILGILQAVYFVIATLFIVSLPFNIYCLVKSISILIINSEKYNQDFLLPAVRHAHHGAHVNEDNTYLTEQKKILWVLGRYTLYREKITELTEQVQGGSTLTPESVQVELAAMPFYEEIKPATPHIGRTARKSRHIAIFILLGLVLLFLLTILFPLLGLRLKV